MAVMVAGGEAVAARSAPATRRDSMKPYYAYRVAESLVRVLPRRTAYWLGDRAADTLLLAVPRKFDALRANLRHVLPEADEALVEQTVRRNLRNLTHSWVDVMEMSSRKANLPQRLDIEGLENHDIALKRGGGIVMVSIHYGCWEAGLAGWNAMGGRMALLAEVLRPQELFERVIGARGKQRVQVIPIDVAAMRAGGPSVARRLGASSMREVLKVLKAGGTIAMALDRDLVGNGEPISFFGTPARIPVGVVDIAIRAGSAVVPVILFRDDRRIHAVAYPEIEYSTTAPRETEVRRVTERLLALFEGVIRQHPDQWHVLDSIWTDTAKQ